MDPLPIDDDASVHLARRQVGQLGRGLGLPEVPLESARIIVSELARNQLRHGRLGEILLRGIERDGVAGLSIVARDAGPGLVDPVAAFRGHRRPGQEGLGIGLAGVRRLADELDVVTRTREGLTLHARLFAAPVLRAPEVAVVGRPHPDEIESGDDSVVVREEHRIVVGLADGLGHGPKAREASAAACRCVRQHASLPPLEVLRRCDERLRGTRGSAMAVAALDLRTDELVLSVAGNIRAGLYRPEGGRRFGFAPRVLGAGRGRRLREERVARDGRCLVLFTDGLPDRTDPSLDRPGITGWPLPLAARLLARHGRDTDDATVLALR